MAPQSSLSLTILVSIGSRCICLSDTSASQATESKHEHTIKTSSVSFCWFACVLTWQHVSKTARQLGCTNANVDAQHHVACKLKQIYAPLQGDCCAACEALPNCNIWVWCANFGGCKYGINGTFPMYGCDLKHQDNYTDIRQLPVSFNRGPPTPFTSGSFLPFA